MLQYILYLVFSIQVQAGWELYISELSNLSPNNNNWIDQTTNSPIQQMICAAAPSQFIAKGENNLKRDIILPSSNIYTQVLIVFDIYLHYQWSIATDSVTFYINNIIKGVYNADQTPISDTLDSHYYCYSYSGQHYDTKFHVEQQFEYTSSLIELFFEVKRQTNSYYGLSNFLVYRYKSDIQYCLKEASGKCEVCDKGFSTNKSGTCQCQWNKYYNPEIQCVQFCPIGYTPDNQRRCQPTIYTPLFTDLTLPIFTSYGFQYIQDSQHPYTYTTNKILTINSKSVGGEFRYNDMIEYSPLSISAPKLISITFSLYFQGIYAPYYEKRRKAYQYSKVNLIINNYLIQGIQIFDQFEIFSLMHKLANTTCGDYCIKTDWEYIYKINEPITSLKFSGHFSIHHPEINWSIRDLIISDLGQTVTPTPCNTPCSTCKSSDQSYCYSCIGTYVLYYGECLDGCPSFTTLSSGICTDPIITTNSQYITNLYGNQRYVLKKDFPNIPETFSTFLYGASYTVIGGYSVWPSSQQLKYFRSGLDPFYKIDIYFTVMFIDQTSTVDQYLKFTSSTGTTVDIKITTEPSIGNVQGDKLPEFQLIYHYSDSFPSTDQIQFTLECIQASTYTTTQSFYCAIYNFRVVVQKCSTYCSTCDISGNCVSVKTSSNTSGTGCGDGFFFDNDLGECSKCADNCKTCDQSSDHCLSCDTNHILSNNTCYCPNFLANHPTCSSQDCSSGCLTCENQNNCLTCDITKHKWLNIDKCECQDGYFQEYDQSCHQCYPTCKTCVANPRLCLSCDSSQKRYLAFQQCECDDGYFQDNTDLTCTHCETKCQTCKYTSDSCTSCNTIQHRTLSSNQCICADGYFESGVDVCEECSNLCATCSDKNICLSCKKSQGRQLSIYGKVCVCQSGYFQMEGQPSCDLCNYTCLECTAKGADSCYRCPDSREQSSPESPFYCKCKRGYYEAGQSKQCSDCQNYINPPSTHYCYSKCGDGIVQWNEDCDDMNNNTRDGCINCLFPTSHCLDEPCISCRASQCTGCKDGYYLGLDSICHKCSSICKTCKTKADNCITCMLTASDGTCVKCTAEQGLQILNGQCVNICGDGLKVDGEQCDDGNTDNGDGCDSNCQIESGSICQVQCEAINYVDILLSTNELDTIYDPIRHIILQTDQPVQVTGSIVDQIDVKITNYTEFSVNYNDQTVYNDSYYTIKVDITINLNQTITSPIAVISLTQPDNIANIQGYSILTNSNITKLKDYLIPSENVKTATTSLMNFSQYILYIMLGLAGIAFLFGGLHIFWNLLELLQLLSYIKYFNVQYPYNVQVYFALFGFAEFDFLKEQINLEDFISQYIDTPDAAAKFQEEGYSTVFYVNAIAVVTVFATTLGTYLLCSLVSLIVKFIAKSIVTSKIEDDDEAGVFFFFVMKITKNLENYLFHITAEFKSGILRTFMAVAFDLNLAIFLQLFDLNTQNLFLLSSGILSIVVFIIEIYYIYFGFRIMANPKYYLELKATQNSYGALYEGLLINNKSFIRGFNLLNLLKKMTFMFFLVFLYNVPSFQILFVSLLNLIFAVYIIYVKPFEEQSEYYKTYISEIIIWIVELVVLLFAYNEQTSNFNTETQLLIGWLVIGLCTLLILIQLGIDVKQHADFLMKEYSILRRLVDRLRGLLQSDESGKEEENIFLNKHMRMHVPGAKSKSTIKSKKVVTFTLSSSSDS